MESDIYNETNGLGKIPSGKPQQCDLLQWAYYHYGRYSFSTPSWWASEVNNEDGKVKKFDNDHVKYLGSEGIDNDNDGRINEDRWYYDPNRD